MELDYFENENCFVDRDSQKQYNCNDATDMIILCREVNAFLIQSRMDKDLLQHKLEIVRRVIDD